ncbi:hypothetical protein PR002_g18098, partial [Phytophthora rubi]
MIAAYSRLIVLRRSAEPGKKSWRTGWLCLVELRGPVARMPCCHVTTQILSTEAERWEARALSTMFGGSSSDDGGALREAFNAIEEADEEPSPNGRDDSDYQDTPSADRDAKEDEQQDEDDAEEGEDNEDDENQGGEDDEEESEEDEEEAENEDGDDGEENEEDGGGKEVNELTDQREGDESERDDEEETDDKFGVAPNLHQIAHQR